MDQELLNGETECGPTTESESEPGMSQDSLSEAHASETKAVLPYTVTAAESEKEPLSHGEPRQMSEQGSTIKSLEREHLSRDDVPGAVSLSNHTDSIVCDENHTLSQQHPASSGDDGQQTDDRFPQHAASGESDDAAGLQAQDSLPVITVSSPENLSSDKPEEELRDTEVVPDSDSMPLTESNSILRDIFESTMQSVTALKETTEKGSQEIKDQLVSLVTETRHTNFILGQLLEQLKTQQQRSEEQVKNLTNELRACVLPRTVKNEEEGTAFETERPSIQVYRQMAPYSSPSIDSKAPGRIVSDKDEHDPLSVYYMPYAESLPYEKEAPERPQSDRNGQSGEKQNLPQASHGQKHGLRQSDARSSNAGNGVSSSTNRKLPSHQSQQDSFTDRGDDAARSKTQGGHKGRVSRLDSQDGVNEKKFEKETNRFSTSNALSFKPQQNAAPDNNGQQFDSAPRDARPKEPRVSGSPSHYTGRGNDLTDRELSGSARTSRRSTVSVSAMGLTLESGSEVDSARLHDAIEKARAPDPNPPPKAKSFDTVLCLDISQSMWTGGAFDQMIGIANEFIDGIEDIVNDSGVEENIGLVTFGGRANVVQHLTNDFSRVRDAMERIVVSGKSPFYEAMVVSLVAFDGRGGTVSVSGEYDVRPRIIFISDGHITEASDDLDAQDRVIDAANTRAAFSRLMMDIAPSGDRGMPHPIIFIPVGTRADRTFLQSMATLNGSPLVEPENIDTLCHYFRVQGTIGKVIVTLQNKENGGTEDNIQAVVRALEPDLDDNEMSQVVKKVQEELSQPGRQKRRKSKPTDFDDVFEDKDGVMTGDRLPLGARVVRGPDWHWGNQDSNGPGTVIQHDNKRHPFTWVLWDSGEYNRYAYGSEMGFQVWKTDEHPRVKVGSEGLQVGMKVKKGPNWDSEDPKYGKGIGSVIRKSKDGQQIKVRWGNGEIQTCEINAVVYCDPFTEDQDEPAPRTLAEDLFGHRLNQDDSPNLDDEGMEDGELAWQWKDDWGRWRLYSDQNQAALEKAYKRKHDGTCVIQRGGQNFRVLFKRKSEKDLDTMIEREIKRVFLPFEEYESLRKVEEMI